MLKIHCLLTIPIARSSFPGLYPRRFALLRSPSSCSYADHCWRLHRDAGPVPRFLMDVVKADASIPSDRPHDTVAVPAMDARRSSPSMVDAIHKSTNERSAMLMLAFVTAVALLRGLDGFILWSVVGMILNHFFSKTLKRIIRQPRPPMAPANTDISETSGMPSSHAQSLAFLSVYACLGGFIGTLDWNLAGCCKQGALLLAAIYMAWLRVREGYHTVSQVLAGGMIGTICAVVWLNTALMLAPLGSRYRWTPPRLHEVCVQTNYSPIFAHNQMIESSKWVRAKH